jgi:thiamine biosynthesis lipoprotein
MVFRKIWKRWLPLVLGSLLGLPLLGQSPKLASKSLVLMGSNFELTALHPNDTLAWQAVEAGIAEIRRIEALISSWQPNSQTSEINRMAGIRPVRVAPELLGLIQRACKVSRLTDGAFDITFAATDSLWQFDQQVHELPDSATVAASVAHIDWQKIIIDEKEGTVFLQEKGMKIGFGALGKGYAANRARKRMQGLGIASGLVNAGGDLTAWGTDEQGEPWKIGIADPQSRERIIAWLQAEEQAVVTSGNYEKYFLSGGQRYAHIIDPRSGWPARGLKSVTVVCPDAELADALATAVFVLGPQKGLQLIDQLRGIACLLVTEEDKLLRSRSLQLAKPEGE